MTDEQIVKALECCVSYENHLACRGCPFSESGVCEEDGLALQKHSLALIKRQKAEIEDLKADKEALINGQLTIQKMYIEARDKAVREFAEKLKKWKYQSSDWSHGEHPFVVEETDIDDLVIEMTEKEGGKG